MPQTPVRIFVSSPADVDHERSIVRDVIERLTQDYLPYFPLRAILWEEEALTADRTFQASLTRPSECEIVLVIVWTRLGSPLPEDPYRGMTGTEWEFVDAVASSNRHGLPEVLVYKKGTPRLVDITNAEAAQEAIADRRRLDDFFRSHFFHADNTFKRAFRTFDGDAQFRELVEVQLRKLLNRRISAERRSVAGETRWHGSPFRAGRPFDLADERIFTGREAELRELAERLQTRAAAGCPFVLLSGPSGCGKTSLLRAGLAPLLLRPFRFERIAAMRYCLVDPASADHPCMALATALGADSCLGESLRAFGLEAAALATLLANDPALAARQLGAALVEIARAQGSEGDARLVIIVDPLDGILHESSRHGGAQASAALARALSACCSSGAIWVVAALRSDALCWLPGLPDLAQVLDESGWQSLEPLPSGRLRQIIEIPARVAGVELEAGLSGPGRGLIELIEADAEHLRLWAPPVQAALHAIYQAGSQAADQSVLLSARAWQDLGGLAGQLRERADGLWRSGLESGWRAQLPRLCRALIRLDGQGGAQMRAANLAVLEQDADTRALIAVMIEARLLIADAECDPGLSAHCEPVNYSLTSALRVLWSQTKGEWRGRWRRSRVDIAAAPAFVDPAEGVGCDSSAAADWSRFVAVVSFAHPILLHRWEPVADWLADPDNRTLLRLREQLSRQARLWKRTSCNREYLFGDAGFAEVRHFAVRFPDELEPLEREFLAQNGAYLAFVRRRNQLVRGLAVLLILLLMTASVAAWIAQRKSDEARLALHRVQIKEANLKSFQGNTPLAVAKALEAGGDLPADAIRTLSLAFSRNRLLAMAPTPSPQPDQPYLPAANPEGTVLATIEPGQGVRKWQLNDGRFVPADAPVLTDGRLGIHSLVIALEDDSVFGVAPSGVYRLPAVAGDAPAFACGALPGAALALDAARRTLAIAVPGDAGDQSLCVMDLTHPGSPLFQHQFHEQQLRGLSFSADGSALLTASEAGRTHLIDLVGGGRTPGIRLSLPADAPLGRPFNKAVFDPDGRRIAIAAVDERVRLYHGDGRPIAELSRALVDGKPIQVHRSAVRDLAFAPDGSSLVAVDDEGQVVRWSLGDPIQPLVLGFHDGLSVVSVDVAEPASSTDGAAERETLVLTASLDGTARLWSLATGRPMAIFGHDGALNWARFSASARHVLSHSVRDASLRLWSVKPVSRLAFELKHADPTNHVWHLDFSPAPPELIGDARGQPGGAAVPLFLATAGFDGRVNVWRYQRDRRMPALSFSFAQQDESVPEAPEKPVRRVQFSPSGRLLAAARFDGTARIYNLLTGRSCRLQAADSGDGKVFRALFDPQEQWLLTTSDDTRAPVRLFDPRRCEPVAGADLIEKPGSVTEAAAIRSVGANVLVATADNAGRVRVLSVNDRGDWSELCALQAAPEAIKDIAIAPDGRSVAMAGTDSRLALLELKGTACGRLRQIEGHVGSLYTVAFSPDGSRLVTASMDKTARVWTRDGQPIAVLGGHQDRVYSASFSPGDGRWILTASRDGSLGLWRTPPAGNSKQPVVLEAFLPLPASLGGAASAAFSPDGRYVAGSYWENAALLWRLWREDSIPGEALVDRWGEDRAQLALLKEAHQFCRDNQVSISDTLTREASGAAD